MSLCSDFDSASHFSNIKTNIGRCLLLLRPTATIQHIKLYIGPYSSTERNKNADPMDNKGAFLLLLVGLRRYSLGLSHTLLITWTRNCAAVAGINNKGVFCGRNFTLRIAYRIAEVALYAVASPEVFRPSMDFLPRLVRSRLKDICRCFPASMQPQRRHPAHPLFRCA